jgi:hypothetical protein
MGLFGAAMKTLLLVIACTALALPAQAQPSDWSALKTLKKGQRVLVIIAMPRPTARVYADHCKHGKPLTIAPGPYEVIFRSVTATQLRVDYPDCPNAELPRDEIKGVVLLRDADKITIYAVSPVAENLPLILELKQEQAWNRVKSSLFPRQQALWVVTTKGETILCTYDSITPTQFVITRDGKMIYLNKSDVKEISTVVKDKNDLKRIVIYPSP